MVLRGRVQIAAHAMARDAAELARETRLLRALEAVIGPLDEPDRWGCRAVGEALEDRVRAEAVEVLMGYPLCLVCQRIRVVLPHETCSQCLGMVRRPEHRGDCPGCVNCGRGQSDR